MQIELLNGQLNVSKSSIMAYSNIKGIIIQNNINILRI